MELPNRSRLHHSSYEISGDDIKLAMADYDDADEVAVWHTHPRGLVGPSERDVALRPPPEVPMLVVALTPDGPVPSWF